VERVVKPKAPDYFPLNESPAGWPTRQLVLADWQRWKKLP
jgi:hypothetical protein